MFLLVFGFSSLIIIISFVFILVKIFSVNSNKSCDTLVDKKKVYLHVYDSTQKRAGISDTFIEYRYTVRFNKSYDDVLYEFYENNLYSFSSMMRHSIFGVDKGYVCEAYECTYKTS